jgi:Protein of unknown function (DUF3071)
MRALRVVGIAEDGAVVLEDSGRRERYTVAADEQLRAAARGDLTRLGQIAIELESQLRPREIQARIRAGASVEQVAAAAGVPPQKIERFAYPVLLERSRTAEVAQRAHPVRADGPDARMLGDVIAHTFGLRGLEYTESEWDSWKGEDGRWVVALSWRAGRSDNRAHWTRPLRTVGPVIDIARQEEPTEPGPPEELRAAASDTARGSERMDALRGGGGMRTDSGRDRAASTRPSSEQRVGAPPAQRQTDTRRPDARAADNRALDARTHDARTPDAQPARATEEPPVASERADSAATAEPTPDTSAAESPATDAGSANRRTKKGKPVMPSWDEVLLGVRGQR